VQYNGRYGTYALDSILRHADGKTSDWYSVTAAGSLAYAGGLFGFARPVNDSFTFVMVDSLKDVNVRVNNEIVGRTDSSGSMIIPTMASYQVNQITMDTSRVPMDYSMSGVSSDIAPSAWSGSCISFSAARVRAVTGKLFAKNDIRKEPLEYYEITMMVGDKKLAFQTGKGGEFYFEDALPREPGPGSEDQRSCRSIKERKARGGGVIKPGLYPASVDYGGQKCAFTITVPITEDVITDIGEIVCAAARVSEPAHGAQ
jgi:outer membrane usher protein FimD/PapC